ncbi:MAG: helix-turn-helix domain-containing protein [Bacillota bacterium]|jgi:cytoskeleton protein RodZ
MEEIISRLVEARHKAKLSLEDIQERTKIPLRQLEYLESCQFDKIGPPVYVKGFIRRYAQEVGLDAYRLWEHEGSQVVPVTASRRLRRQRRPFRINLAPFLRIALILSLVVVAGLLIRTAVNSFLQPQPPAPPDPPQNQEEPGPEEEDPLEQPEPQASIEEVQADDSEAIYVVHNADSLNVVLTYTGNCWTRVTADGVRLSSATYKAGHVEELNNATVLRIRFGAPKFVTVVANGIEIDTPDLQKGFNLEIRLAEKNE